MRGHPILQWCLFSLVWMLLVLPIAKVTLATGRATEASAPPSPLTSPTWVTLTFSTPPHEFSVGQGDVTIWREEHSDAVVFEKALPLDHDGLGMDVDVAADLPEGRAAVEVRVESDGFPPASRTLWVEGPFEERVIFRWGQP